MFIHDLMTEKCIIDETGWNKDDLDDNKQFKAIFNELKDYKETVTFFKERTMRLESAKTKLEEELLSMNREKLQFEKEMNKKIWISKR